MMDVIDKAFQVAPRENFLPSGVRGRADIDIPLPIGFGQTNSQPSTVRLMLEWLNPQVGDKILDVGSGSGWTTALLGYLVGSRGRVYAVERVLELVRIGAENCRRIGINNVKFYSAGEMYGLPDCAPYDRILVSAAASRLPKDLINQLKIGGRMVIPMQNSIFVVNKTSQGEYEAEEYPDFAFVPLV